MAGTSSLIISEGIGIALIFLFTLFEQEMPFPLVLFGNSGREEPSIQSCLVAFKQNHFHRKSRFQFIVAQRIRVNWAPSLDLSRPEIVGAGASRSCKPLTEVLVQAGDRWENIKKKRGESSARERAFSLISPSRKKTALDVLGTKVSAASAAGRTGGLVA